MKSKKLPVLISILFLLNSFSAFTQDSLLIPLWKNGAPGFEGKKNEPEEAKDWWVKNINNPTLTFFRAPQAIATSAAVIICPGGGIVPWYLMLKVPMQQSL